MTKNRIVFFGTPDFAVTPLERLVENGYDVCAVVTREDKPRGRGHEMVPTPVKTVALRYGIPVLHPVKMKDPAFVEQLRGYEADFFVVVAFGRILRKEILEMPKKACINIHGSLLPAYRGADPIQWAVIDGCDVSGVTTMKMDEGIDTGDILRQYPCVLSPNETGGSLFEKLAQIGGEAILDTLQDYDTIVPVRQGDATTEYARMLTKEDGRIDWNQPAKRLECLIRGLNPWPSAYTFIRGKLCKIWAARVLEEAASGIPGEILSNQGTLKVATGNGVLEILELQLEGKRRMRTDDLLRGVALETGEIFGKE